MRDNRRSKDHEDSNEDWWVRVLHEQERDRREAKKALLGCLFWGAVAAIVAGLILRQAGL